MLKTAKTATIALLLFGAMCGFSYGAPAIGSVAGSFAQSGSVSLSGTGFGTGDATPLLWDDFEGGKNGNSLPASPKIGSWTILNGGPVYTNGTAHSGSISATSAYSDGGFRNICWERMSLATGAVYYQSYWFRYNSPAGGSGQTKLTQLWGTEQINDYSPGVMTGGFAGDWWATYIALESGGYQQDNYPFIPSRNQWHLFEMILKQSDVNVANGRVTILIDGKTIYNKNPVKTREHAGQGWLFTTFFDGMTNWGGSTQTWIDDVYFNDSWARVELGDKPTYSSCTHREIQVATAWSDGSITVKCNVASFQAGQTAYLFVVDANGVGNAQGYPIVIGGGSADAPPSINITSPTSESNYLASQSTVQIAGSATDDDGVTNVTWNNSRGGSGAAVNNSGNWSSWSIANISLQEGENIITVTATDTANQSVTDTLNVTYSSIGIVQAWSATAQTGDSSWTNSSVTPCVRLLIEGSKVTQSGNQIKLGFQGRASGNYTIKKVSIAKRDTAGLEGDVVDSTWTKVTFDGKSVSTWATDIITVPAGLEKPSNAIAFPLQAGNDYYVTFKIETASVYLDPPSTYRELFFYSADHTDDIDWGQNGHSSMQNFPALSRIYVLSGNGSAKPIAPKNLKLK